MAAEPERADSGDAPVTFVLFCLLVGQPAVVFALAVASPTPLVFAVIGGGTLALAATATRGFRTRGYSADRLVDFVLVVAATQIVVALVFGLFLSLLDSGGVTQAALRPAAVVLGYPVAYYVVYRRAPLSLPDLGFGSD
ncbi:hypothetical protein [Halorientalis litorea]|jgi:hypothetical protein|uniref:hypothetical protein n=1 Tax=Halorientalis litorea TaxID=2931977 RepID=UPI001FF6C12D|nr:hypothetical protein [Halorientalis litorea]